MWVLWVLLENHWITSSRFSGFRVKHRNLYNKHVGGLWVVLWKTLKYPTISTATRTHPALKVQVQVEVVQSCPTLCDPVDYAVHGILQPRILEWVAFPFSRGSSQPRDRTQVSRIAGGFFTTIVTIKIYHIPWLHIPECLPLYLRPHRVLGRSVWIDSGRDNQWSSICCPLNLY